jgi:uncharacterized protein
MQVLTISDEVVREVYSGTAKERFRDVQLILGCGDLPPSYLEFAVSILNVPCLYVPGNHDARPEQRESGETAYEPAGCDSIDGRLKHINGLAIAGLGGSPWYNGDLFQYTERQMWQRTMLLSARIWLWQRRSGRPLDIMITHAAPQGIHDGPGAHRGFKVFRWFIDRFQPRYFVHGHVHPSYGYNKTTQSMVGHTNVINTVGYRVLDVAVPESEPSIRAYS